MTNPFSTLYKWFTGLIVQENEELLEKIKGKDEEISRLNVVIGKLKIRKDLSFPNSYGQITLNDSYSLLTGICNDVYISDMFFDLTTKDEASKFSEETAVQYRTWIAENHDCDNFSFALNGYWSDGLKSFAFGIAWSNNHAFNVMIDKDKEIWIVEPQSNKWLSSEEAKIDPKYYPIKLIVM